jgi:hypothetical protein
LHETRIRGASAALRGVGPALADCRDIMTTPSSSLRLHADRSTPATDRLHTLRRGRGALLALPLLAACGLDGGEQYGELTSAVTVASYTTSSCSTSVVIGLSKQIADEISCMSPTLLSRFSASTNLQITSNAVLPYLHSTAKTDLLAVAQGRTVQVNSAFRSVVQQYLLYRWYQLGRCGITAAATPGKSNHESGRALDLANYSSLISAMGARGWSHDVPGDPVHFDHLSSPDIRGKDVLAFQRLWNRNNPGDKISEDGAYGPQTEARLKSAPATGFTTGPTCGNGLVGADVVAVDGPDRLAPGAKAHYTIMFNNTTEVDWPASTKLRVVGGSSELYDPATWASRSEPGTLGVDVPAGTQGAVEIGVLAPTVTAETPVFMQLELVDGDQVLGLISLAATVVPDGSHEDSADAGDENDDGIETTGGCSAGGGAGGLALLVPALALMVLRRRRR